MSASEIAQRLDAKRSGQGWAAKCPAHDDRNASLSICEGADGRTLLNCHAGCAFPEIVSAAGLTTADCFPEKSPRIASTPRKIVATYPYRDANGNLLFECVRYEPKNFRQRQPDGAGGWKWNLQGVQLVLFGLPEITRDVKRGLPILVCEGEKDALALVAAGFSATCNPMGAGKWRDSYTDTLKGANCHIIPDNDGPGRKHAEQVAAALHGKAASVRIVTLPEVLNGQRVKDPADFFAAGGDSGGVQSLCDAAPEWQPLAKPETLADRLAKRQFNFAVMPPSVVPRYSIAETPISTPGNLTAISAAVKSGKSSFIGAMQAATMAGPGCDCLGINSANPQGLAVIHFDTEQSIEDHDTLARRTLRRAKRDAPPSWFQSFCLTGFSVPDMQAALRLALEQSAQTFGGIHSVFLDGVADLVPDVNDAETCNAFVAELHALAIRYACPIVGVIHLNPNGEKTRGHLGSQLERKAETNLRLERDGEAIVCWSEKNRRAPISKTRGPRFVWSDEHGMHVSAESLGNARTAAERADMETEAQAVFTTAEKQALRYGEIITLLMTEVHLSKSTAKRRLGSMIKADVVRREFAGLYTLSA